MRLTPLLALARTLGPGALKTVARVAPLLATHPEAVRQGRQLLEQLAQARAGRSPEERLRRTVAALRGEAVRARDRAGDGAGGGDAASSAVSADRAAEWVRQADSLSTALALVELRRGADRRRDLDRVQARTDALFAEVFTATVGDTGRAPDPAPGP